MVIAPFTHVSVLSHRSPRGPSITYGIWSHRAAEALDVNRSSGSEPRHHHTPATFVALGADAATP
jgi:hypothetical protein